MIPTDFIFLIFIVRVVFFLWSELIWVQFYFIFIFLFHSSWSESIQVDPTRTGGPSWSGPTFVPASFKQVWNITALNAFFVCDFHHCSCLSGRNDLVLVPREKIQWHDQMWRRELHHAVVSFKMCWSPLLPCVWLCPDCKGKDVFYHLSKFLLLSKHLCIRIWGKKLTQTNGNVAYYPLLMSGDEVFLVLKWFSFKSPLYVFCMWLAVEAEQCCLCNQQEFGLMVVCNKMDCTITWFHLACVGLKAAPKGKWICPRCEYIRGIFYSISTIV